MKLKTAIHPPTALLGASAAAITVAGSIFVASESEAACITRYTAYGTTVTECSSPTIYSQPGYVISGAPVYSYSYPAPSRSVVIERRVVVPPYEVMAREGQSPAPFTADETDTGISAPKYYSLY